LLAIDLPHQRWTSNGLVIRTVLTLRMSIVWACRQGFQRGAGWDDTDADSSDPPRFADVSDGWGVHKPDGNGIRRDRSPLDLEAEAMDGAERLAGGIGDAAIEPVSGHDQVP
jgi:hypothetical protein